MNITKDDFSKVIPKFPLALRLALDYMGDVINLDFDWDYDAMEYLNSLSSINSIWLFTYGEDENVQVIVTEDIELMKNALFEAYNTHGIDDFMISEHQSYEDAYKMALSIMEINPRCYE